MKPVCQRHESWRRWSPSLTARHKSATAQYVETTHKKEMLAKMSAVIMHFYDSLVTNGLPEAFRGLTSFGVSF